ncbi:acyltransferase [Limnobacter profundi]|uniref:Acyltransferase n=1 Tax=Limnobacter profundi TaxID=2732163 RepID=A0ABX6N8L9_9BURK|nr:acyltransferase [Limnobacter sp. SAORIC-580]QJR30730.1 acyltransferase [Limnobacter sp. SAORIC-580]
MNTILFLTKLIIVFLPWMLKRLILIKFFGYKIENSSRIGWSWVFPDVLVMKKKSSIGNFNYFKKLEHLELGEYSTIGSLNLINGFPRSKVHYATEERRLALILGSNSSITNQHIIDCTDEVIIGEFVTIAGYRTQILTHSINIYKSKQECKGIFVGDFCFIGSGSIVLSGVSIANASVVAAGSVVNSSLLDEGCLYGGVPAVKLKKYECEVKYFEREVGHVD